MLCNLLHPQKIGGNTHANYDNANDNANYEMPTPKAPNKNAFPKPKIPNTKVSGISYIDVCPWHADQKSKSWLFYDIPHFGIPRQT